MKRIILFTVLILIMTVGFSYTASFTVFGKVYNEDGSKGTNLTANSFCGLKVYRKSIPGEIGVQNIGENINCPQKIFPADYGGIDTPAYFNSDVGSYNWPTVVGVGQYVVAIVETYENQFPLCLWTGNSYVGARIKILSQQEIANGGVDMPDTRLELIPVPKPQAILSDSVTLTWTGLSYDPDNLITGYTVYRSTEPGGIGGYVKLPLTAPQNKGGIVSFTDSGLNQNDTYYYKIAVNFEWGGGNGAPDYFVSNAMSAAGPGIYLGQTPTITPTMTDTPYFTHTQTVTETPSFTYTPTLTYTDTQTDTPTETYTQTKTWTPSYTVTLTETSTITITASPTGTYTFTETPTYTLTLTPTITYTQQPQIAGSLKQKLLKERIIVLNNPIKDGNLKIALYNNESDAVLKIYMYNITGELVMKINKNIPLGFSIIQEKISKASGIYILRAVIKTEIETINLPVKKVGIISK